MADLNFNELLLRRPWTDILPDGYMDHTHYTSDKLMPEPDDPVMLRPVTQADFLREYYPSGHHINDEIHFPNVIKKDPETGKWYEQPVTRCAFAFQQIIATKQVIHITGNDVQMELAEKSKDAAIEKANGDKLVKFRTGWMEKNMEERFYEAVRSYKITGDAAIVGYYRKDGKFGAKTLSFLNGDKLYPHYDALTGELNCFVRRYSSLNDDGQETMEWLEVWDDTFLYRAKRGKLEGASTPEDGWEIVSKKKHGFNFVPVAYARCDDGACWRAAQRTIELYEEAFSYFCENNKAFAFPIMYLKGSEVEIKGDMNGSVKAITMGEDDEAGFLNRQDVSEAFNTELSTLYKLIYEQAFAVQPPELKSGDLPGVAVKLLYSPAIEKAIRDAEELQDFLDTLILIVKHGYGHEMNMEPDMVNLKINAWIKPYIHQNETELFTNMATAVQNEFMSRQTASERVSMYAKNDEYERIMRERKKEQEMDLLVELEKQDNQTDNDIREQTAAAKNGQGGQDVNTGHGSKIRHTDENGNWPDENNWEGWNKKH